ncbi:Fc receptor-like protein 5 isoform X1, partial [Clarias magur]
LISLIPVAHVEEWHKAVVTVTPDEHVFIGERVTLTCDIQSGGGTQWTYSWYKSNGILTRGEDRSYKDSIRKEFIIQSVTDSDSGVYTCKGQRWYPQSSEVTATVTLTVSLKPKPTLTVNPQHSLYTGDIVTLTCDLKEGTGWEFLWYKYNPAQNSELKSTNTLKVTVDKAGEIKYDCLANRGDYYTKPSDPVKITVKGRPKAVVSIIPDTHVFIGERVTARCDIQGGEGIQWTNSWNKDNLRLIERTYEVYTGNMYQLTISSVKYSDRGVYTCTGQNSDYQNSEISDDVTLTVSVKPKPTLTVNPRNSLYIGDTITLTCDLQKGTDWKFFWYKLDLPLSGEEESTNTLTVTVDEAGEIEYQCKAYREKYYTKPSDPVQITVK